MCCDHGREDIHAPVTSAFLRPTIVARDWIQRLGCQYSDTCFKYWGLYHSGCVKGSRVRTLSGASWSMCRNFMPHVVGSCCKFQEHNLHSLFIFHIHRSVEPCAQRIRAKHDVTSPRPGTHGCLAGVGLRRTCRRKKGRHPRPIARRTFFLRISPATPQ